MADEKLNVGIHFNVTGNADAAAALTALGTAAAETAAEFDAAAVSAKAMATSITLDPAAVKAAQDAHTAIMAGFGQVEPPVPLGLESAELYTAAAEAQAAAQAEAAVTAQEEAAATTEVVAAAREATVAKESEAAAVTTANAELRAGAIAARELSAAEAEAAIAAKALADASTAAQALSALGIRAKAPGVVNAEGQGLVTVAQEEQANAQAILNRLGLEATAVTSEQAAATARLAEASATAAASIAEQAAATTEGTVAAERLAVAETEAGGAGEAMRAEATGATSAFGGMWTQLIAVVAALEAYSKAKAFIETGIAFNSAIESARLGIAASVTAMATLTDAEGKALTGQEGFAAATAVADDQIQKLFADSARTSTTVQQLVTTYQSLIGAGLKAGATLDQIRKLTTDAALAAGAFSVPYSQLSVTLVQLLNGHAQIRNRLTADLGITTAMLKDWKEHNRLVENLLEKFGQFESLGTRVQGTWRGIMSNVKEFAQQFSGAATSGAFTTLETGLKGQLGRVFDFNTGKLTSNVAGAADLMREGLGGAAQLVVDLVGKIVDGLERMGTWFEQNQLKAEAMGRDFLELVTNTGRIVVNIAAIVASVIAWAAQSLAVQSVLAAVGDILGFIAEHIRLIGTALAVWGAIAAVPAILAAMAISIPVLIAGFVALVAVLEAFSLSSSRAAAAAAAARQGMIEHAASTAGLVAQYQALASAIDSGTLKGAALKSAQEQLKTVTDELIKISPAYRDALQSETTSLNEKLAIVEKLHQAELAEFATKRDVAVAQVAELDKQESDLETQLAGARKAQQGALAEGVPSAAAGAEVGRLSAQLDTTRKQLQGAAIDAHAAIEAIKGADAASAAGTAKGLATVKPKPEPGADKGDKGLAGAEANAAIERMKAQAATITRELDGQLARNEISYSQYFGRLNAIELTALDVQIAAKQKQLDGTKDPKEKVKLGADIDNLQEEETQTVEKNAAKRLQLEQQYEKQRTTIAVEAMKDRGQTELAFEVEFNEKHRAESARALAEKDEATLANIDYLHDAALAKIRADAAATGARGVTSESEGTVQGTKAGVESGAISEAKGRELVIAAYERERAAILGALAAAEALAKISPTPDNIAKVDALSKQYQTVQKSIVQASDTSLHLRQQLAGALSSDLTEFFTKTVEGAHSVGDAFRSLAASVIQSIQQIVSQLIAAKIVKGIASILGGGGNLGDAALGDISNAGIAHAASGGHVSGPGGPTSDRVPAMLSNGEYVVRASAVDRMGVGFFDAVNAGSMRMRAHAGGGIARYADGGMVRAFASGGQVGSTPGVGPEQQGAGSSHHLHVSIDPGLIVETMRSPAGHKVTIETLQRNPKAARQSMRIP